MMMNIIIKYTHHHNHHYHHHHNKHHNHHHYHYHYHYSYVDLIGTAYEENFIATGFGAYLAIPIIREKWRYVVVL